MLNKTGNVIRAEILEQNGRPKGAGIVSFESSESARFAVGKLVLVYRIFL